MSDLGNKHSSRRRSESGKRRSKKLAALDLASGKTRVITVGKSLGSGCSAGVFSARESRQTFAPPFALKILSSSRRTEFLQEQSALSTLDSPYIPKFFFSATLPNSSLLLAMQLGTGGTLLSYVEKHAPLPESIVAMYMYQIFSAVNHAHDMQIVHRDIKLENIVFADKSLTSLLLIDWGISVAISSTSVLTADCGSLHYASPEILRCLPYIGPEVDSWALGVLMYTMLTGCFPYEGSNPTAKLAAMKQKLSFPPLLSPAAAALVTSLLNPVAPLRAIPQEALLDPWFEVHAATAPRQLCGATLLSHSSPYQELASPLVHRSAECPPHFPSLQDPSVPIRPQGNPANNQNPANQNRQAANSSAAVVDDAPAHSLAVPPQSSRPSPQVSPRKKSPGRSPRKSAARHSSYHSPRCDDELNPVSQAVHPSPQSPSRDMMKSSPRDMMKSSPRDMMKSSPRDMMKSSPRDMMKSSPRDMMKSSPRDMMKSSPRDMMKSSPRDMMKSSPRDMQKSSPRDMQKSSPRDLMKSSPRQVKSSLRSPRKMNASPREVHLASEISTQELTLVTQGFNLSTEELNLSTEELNLAIQEFKLATEVSNPAIHSSGVDVSLTYVASTGATILHSSGDASFESSSTDTSLESSTSSADTSLDYSSNEASLEPSPTSLSPSPSPESSTLEPPSSPLHHQPSSAETRYARRFFDASLPQVAPEVSRIHPSNIVKNLHALVVQSSVRPASCDQIAPKPRSQSKITRSSPHPSELEGSQNSIPFSTEIYRPQTRKKSQRKIKKKKVPKTHRHPVCDQKRVPFAPPVIPLSLDS